MPWKLRRPVSVKSIIYSSLPVHLAKHDVNRAEDNDEVAHLPSKQHFAQGRDIYKGWSANMATVWRDAAVADKVEANSPFGDSTAA